MRLFFVFALFAASAAADVSYRIDTIAGSSWVGDNGPATSAVLFQAEGIASDPQGNLYVSDAANHRVRKITTAGVITTFAGTGTAGFSGDGGPASAAQLNSPYGLGVDGIGELYIADLGNARVRRVDLSGNITTVAGGGSLAAGGVNDGSAATLLALSAPRNVAWDGVGSMYISDFTGQRVYRLASDGTLTTAAGTGVAGFSGDGVAAIGSRLSYPAAIAVDRSGTLYIGDTQNHLIRKVVNGTISSLTRAGLPTGMAIDPIGTLYVADQSAGLILTIASTGAVSATPIAAHDICFRIDGYLYSADVTIVERISFAGPNLIVAGGGNPAYGDNGPATAASLRHPSGTAVDAAGNLYIADRDNHRIRRVAPNGTITTVAGTGQAGNSGDEELATKAQLNQPSSVTVDANGVLYIADTGNQRIRVVSGNGTMLPFPSAGLNSPVYALPDGKGNVYVADSGSGAIFEAMASGAVNSVIANLKSPGGLFLDAAGNLYFTEAGGPHVKRLDPLGAVTLIAEGVWNAPRGVAVDSSGNIFVADSGLEQIVCVSPTGTVSVVAGTGTPGLSGDGGDALSAQLNFPWDVSTAPGGLLYLADFGNSRIRRLTPAPAAAVSPVLLVTAVNAASLQPGPVAPGMLLDLIGTGLASTAGLQVLFGGIASPLLALQGSNILVEVPPQIEGQQSVPIQILSQGNLLAQIPAAVAEAAPALYVDSSGQLIADNQDGTQNSASNPAPRGSIVVFYGTGQGVTGLPVSVTIGGYSSDLLYAGSVAGYPGLFQINARVPVGYIGAGQMNVMVTVGQAQTQPGLSIYIN